MPISPTAVQTISGRFFDPHNPRAEDIDLADIGHALDRIPRFNGHTRRVITVAEHSMRVARISDRYAMLHGATVHRGWLRLTALMHDAAEAYIGDIVRPLKTAAHAEIESRVMDAIRDHLDAVFADGERGCMRTPVAAMDITKQADNIALALEALIELPGASAWVPDEHRADLWMYLPDYSPRPGECWLAEVHATIGELRGDR